jgi:hypothetical protein
MDGHDKAVNHRRSRQVWIQFSIIKETKDK